MMLEPSIKTLVKVSGEYHSLYASSIIPKGQEILPLEGVIRNFPTRYTIQVNLNEHLDADIMPENISNNKYHWRFLNHSCRPNAFVNVRERKLIALTDIHLQEEITFNYLTTEFCLINPFLCQCSNPDCFGLIRGYKYLNESQRKSIAETTAPHQLFLLSVK